MKKFIYISLTAVLFFGCQNDEFFKGAGVSFYPAVVGMAEEEDNKDHIILLETTGEVEDGTVKIKVEMSDLGELFTDPPMDDKGIITIPVTGRSIQFTVTALNDVIPDDYTVDFKIVSASGDVSNMGTGKYTLYVEDGDVIPVFAEDFDECSSLNSFTDYEVTGTDGWGCVASFGLNATGAVRANGYNSGDQEQWLISPSLNLNAYDGVSLKFFTDKSFNGPDLELYISTNYDGESNPSDASFSWTQLSPKLDNDNVTDTWTASGNVDISDFLSDSTFVAFVYKSSSSAGAAQWTVDQFEVNIFRPNGSGGGNDNLVELPYTDNFENCDANLKPENFIIYHMTDASEDLQNWRCSPSGVDGSTAVRISAAGGSPAGLSGTSNTWLISKDKFDLRKVGSAILSFDVKSDASGLGTLQVLYSTDYFRESPIYATWEEIPVTLPAKGSKSYDSVGFALDDAAGEIIYLAFRFQGGTQSSSASYDIDNIQIDPVLITRVLDEGFDSEIGSFSSYSVTGDQEWGFTSYGRNDNGARMSGYDGASYANEDWLISPSMDLTLFTAASLEFYTDFSYSGPDIVAKVSTDYTGEGDPNLATWTDLDALLDTSTDFDTWTSSGNLDLTDHISANTYIAFVYTSTTSASRTWTIDDVVVIGNQ